jgi:hypothetical protein
MPAIQGVFFGLPVAQLQELQTKYVTAIAKLADMQSYTLDGRTVSRADLGQIRETLREINAALAQAAGTRRTTFYAGFRTGYPR